MDETALFAEFVSSTPESYKFMKDDCALSELQGLENVEALVELCVQSSSYNIYAPYLDNDLPAEH